MVATVFNLTSASSTVHYFRREGHGLGPNLPANDDDEDYYARKGDEHRKASRWRGSGATALGLTGHVEPGEFRRVLQGYVPETDIRLGRLRDGEHEHRPGVDTTLSAPKSVSLEALLGGPGSARAMRAHDAAVRATLDFVETRLLRTRRWSREERRSVQVNAPMLVAATFRHITSRNNDPQLHTVASQAAMNGVPLPVVARLLGHSNVRMTMRYAHVGDREVEVAAERVGQAIAAIIGMEDPGTAVPPS